MVKNSVGTVQSVALPIKKAQYHNLPSLTEMKVTGIGPFFKEQALTGGLKRDSRVSKWSAMMTRFAYDDFPLEAAFNDASTRDTLKRRIVKGPPQQFRWQAWTAVRSLSYRISETAYEELQLAEEHIETKIAKDVGRTFPEEAYFQEKLGLDTLARVLSKFARKHEGVSYCQGMNFIVGFMLLVSGGREVEVFYMLEDLMESFRGMFTPGFPYLRQCTFVLSHLVQKRLPHVWEALERTGMGSESWTTKWFMTLYTAVTPFIVTVRIWDLLITEGVASLFKVGMAILRTVQMEIIGHELEDVVACFEGLKAHPFNPDELVKQVCRSKFNNKHLRHFERLYRQENPEERDYPSSPKPIKRADSQESKEVVSSTSVSTHTFDPTQSVGSSVDSLKKQTQVPNLPSILRTYCEMEDYGEADGELEDLGDDEEPVNARDVLEDLLQDQNCSILSLESISNLPRKKAPEVDKMISFVNKLPY